MKKQTVLVIGALVVVGLLSAGLVYLYKNEKLGSGGSKPAALSEQQIFEDYGKIAFVFEENQGQVDKQVKFLIKTGSTTIFFTPEEVVYSIMEREQKNLQQLKDTREPLSEPEPQRGVVVRQKFIEVNNDLIIEGQDLLPTKVNYFKGQDPDQWQSEVNTFGKIRYQELYQGIDVVYSSKEGRLHHQYFIQPGVDYRQLQIKLEGITRLVLDEDGNLVIQTELENMGLPKPRAYQEGREIEVNYNIVTDDTYTFQLVDYDHSLPLIIEI